MRMVTAGLFSALDVSFEPPSERQPFVDEEMGAQLSRLLDEQHAVSSTDRVPA